MRNTRLSEMVVNAQADALAKLASGGFILYFDGKQPRSADDPLTVQKCLARMPLPDKAFYPSKDGVIEAVINREYADGLESGDATWFRVINYAGKPLWDGSIGLIKDKEPSDMTVSTRRIEKGARIYCSSLKYKVPKHRELDVV